MENDFLNYVERGTWVKMLRTIFFKFTEIKNNIIKYHDGKSVGTTKKLEPVLDNLRMKGWNSKIWWKIWSLKNILRTLRQFKKMNFYKDLIYGE